MRSDRLIDRRTCLRGFGAALALPLLETMGWAEGRSAKPPVRLAFTYMPHGVIPERFWPADPEADPRSVRKRLSQSPAAGKAGAPIDADALDRSMLDLVLGGAKDLRGKLSQGDQHKLDEYLDGVRALERRIAAMELRRLEAAKEASGTATAKRNATDSAPIEVTIPEGAKRSEYMQVMCDLNVLAFQTDLTRVSTYIGSTPNGVSYPELGFHDQHHSVTHHANEAVKVDKVAKINAFNVSQFAYMVKRLHSLR